MRAQDRTSNMSRAGRKQRKHTKWTPEKEAKFLYGLRKGNTVSSAAAIAGFARQTVYDHRERDKTLAVRWVEAEAEGTEVLEQEAFRRAVQGTDHPVTYEGAITATYKEYSDTLLIFLLKARRPEVYRENVSLTGARGGPVDVRFVYEYPEARA